MSNEILSALPLLEYLSRCRKKEIQRFIAQAKPQIIKLLSNLCYNFNKKNITEDPKHIKKLKPYAKLITSLCKKSHSIKSRKRVLQTGGFAPTLLATLIPLVAQLIAKKGKK